MQVKSFIAYFLLFYKSQLFQRKINSIPQSVLLKTPYYSQWESKGLVAEILSGKLDAREDPKWKQSSAKDKKEYLHWSWSMCGTACIKMMLESQGINTPPMVQLAKSCMTYGGYTINKKAYYSDDYKHSISGLIYAPAVIFLKKEFGVSAKIEKFLTYQQIVFELSQRHYVIASVSPNIRKPSDSVGYRGGHLILVVGYDLHKKQFTIHNPSGLPEKSQEYANISFEVFEKFFGHKGIIVNSSQ